MQVSRDAFLFTKTTWPVLDGLVRRRWLRGEPITMFRGVTRVWATAVLVIGISMLTQAAIGAGGSAEGANLDEVELESVWDGVYTEVQAQRGSEVNQSFCIDCHGSTLRGGTFGGPPLAGGFFMFKWGEKSLQELYDYMRANMPLGRPGTLSSQQYLDMVAFILEANEFPPGDADLQIDRLPRVVILDDPPL